MKKIALAVALVLSVPSAALAQSAYTTGTIASSERAGYPSPNGGGLYAYAPGYNVYGHRARTHEPRSRTEMER